MVKSNTINRAGRATGMLFSSILMLIAVEACSKSETDQSAAKPAATAMEKAGDTLDQVTEKTKTMTNEVVKSAGEMADKAAQSAKDGYDAAGDVVKKTTEKAKDAYQSADRMVSDAVKSGTSTTPSATEMENAAKVPTEQNGDAIETQVNKAMDAVPTLPGK